MLARNRFLLLVVVGGATLAIISLSLQFCKCSSGLLFSAHPSSLRTNCFCLREVARVFLRACLCSFMRSFHRAPIHQTPPPFIPKQSSTLHGRPINIQHRQWDRGCSERSDVLWKAWVYMTVCPPPPPPIIIIVQPLLEVLPRR